MFDIFSSDNEVRSLYTLAASFLLVLLASVVMNIFVMKVVVMISCHVHKRIYIFIIILLVNGIFEHDWIILFYISVFHVAFVN